MLERKVTGREELKMDALGQHALALEVIRHLQHELLGTADEVLGAAVVEVEVVGVDLGEVHAEVVVVVYPHHVAPGKVCLEDVGVEVGVGASQVCDMLLKRYRFPGAVDPRDWPVGLCRNDFVGNGDHGRNTDTGRDEDDGDVAGVVGVEEELAGGVRNVDHGASGHRVDQEVGHNTRMKVRL